MIKIKVLILIMLISGCTVQKYYLTSNPEMINSFQTKKAHDGYLLTLTETYHIQNKVILIPKENATEQVMKNTIQLIQSKNYYQLEKYLATVDSKDNYLPIANGLLKLFRKNYIGAISDLRKNKQSDIQYVVDVLCVDCEYEITLINSTDLNYYVFLQKYQDILDKYELTDFYKEIINNRIKFIRYKM